MNLTTAGSTTLSAPAGSSIPPRGIRAMLVLLLAATLAACHARPVAVPPPVAVVAYTVHATDEQRPQPYPAEVAPRYSTPLSFRVAGKIIERRVRLGDRVVSGQVLARLDPVDQERQVASASAALAAAEHRLRYARQQLDRDRAQFARQLIATNQLEQTEDAEAAALATREQAAAELTLAQDALRYHTLTAEHDGLITSEDADTGQVVSAGQAVYQLAWSGDVDVIIDASASDANHAEVGQPARVMLPSLSSQPLEAQVREIAPAADPQTRTFRIKLTLDAPSSQIRLGTLGEATLLPMQRDAAAHVIDIPSTALFHRGAAPAVWVLEGAEPRLQLRAVTVQGYRDRSVLLAGGLDEGERIVAAGVHTVYAGERVTSAVPPFDADVPASAPSLASSGAQLARETTP